MTDKKPWYGDKPTRQEALEATLSLIAALKENKHQFFAAKKGQVLVASPLQVYVKSGTVILVLKDSPNHIIYRSEDNEKWSYENLRASRHYFRPANDQEINKLFEVDAEVSPEEEVNTVESGDKDAENSTSEGSETK